MSLTFLRDNMLGASKIFVIKKEDTNAIKFSTNRMNRFLDYGIELHYEVHYTDGYNNFVRLDCHVKPYGKYENCTRDEFVKRVIAEHGDEQARKILKFRKKLKDTFLKIGKASTEDQLRYGKYNKYNYWYLVTMDLPNSCSGEQLRQQVEWFIANTRSNLEKTLDGLENILK